MLFTGLAAGCDVSRVLLVASPGGHVDELWEFAHRLPEPVDDHVWVTARTVQTEKLLAAERVLWTAPVASRQFDRAAATLPSALALIRRLRPDLLITTGAALAAPYLLGAVACRVEAHYVESATRFAQPSLTGRLAALLPGVGLHHQGLVGAGGRWNLVASVFDGYEAVERSPIRVGRVVVTVGTERFPFPRAIGALREVLPQGARVLWQLGHTENQGIDGDVRTWLPADELEDAIKQADVVVTHAGVGSVLTALRAGKHPVVIPRRAALGEHVDDHQQDLADVLAQRSLVTVSSHDHEELTAAIATAARRGTVRVAVA